MSKSPCWLGPWGVWDGSFLTFEPHDPVGRFVSDPIFGLTLTCEAGYLLFHSTLRRIDHQIGAAILGPVAGLVGIEGGVVSEVINLESSGVGAPSETTP
jgi:hypothetical protein